MGIIYRDRDVLKDAMDYIAELYRIAVEDSENNKQGPRFRADNRFLAEVWRDAFAKIHQYSHPLSEIPQVYADKQPPVKVISATVEQLEAIIKAHNEKAHGETVHMVRYQGVLKAFVINSEGAQSHTDLFTSDINS